MAKVLLHSLLLFTFVIVSAYTEFEVDIHNQQLVVNAKNEVLGRRGRLLQQALEVDDDRDQQVKQKSLKSVNKTKLIKPTNSTKLSKTSIAVKNQTKLLKLTNSTSTKNKTNLVKPTKVSLEQITPKLNTKQNSTSKASNSTKLISDLSNTKPKNKTQLAKKTTAQKKSSQSSYDSSDDIDLVSEFRDLPYKFQETLLPDLQKISTTSKLYINKANKEMTRNFKPIVGKKYAAATASIVSFAFILVPLVLVSLIFNRIKAHFSLQKLLIFVQIYLSIYFSILCLSSLVTGLEPLKFFYATSQSTYICIQLLQTLGYVLYLLLLLMYLVLIFSTEIGLGSRFLGLVQTIVGFAVGLHYYVTVFHMAVLRQPPRTSWKVHGVYAMCFVVICVLERAEWRKKAYLAADGVEQAKDS